MFTTLFPLSAILLIIAVGALWAHSSNKKRAREQENRRAREELRARMDAELPLKLREFPEIYRAAVVYCGAYAKKAAIARNIQIAAGCFRNARWSAANKRNAEARSSLDVGLTFLEDAKRLADQLRSDDQADKVLGGE